MPKMNECLKPHVLLHTLTGIGLGLILSALSHTVAGWGVTLGLAVVVLSIAGEFVWNK